MCPRPSFGSFKEIENAIVYGREAVWAFRCTYKRNCRMKSLRFSTRRHESTEMLRSVLDVVQSLTSKIRGNIVPQEVLQKNGRSRSSCAAKTLADYDAR